MDRDIGLAVVDDDPLYLDYLSNLLALQGGMRVTCLASETALFETLPQEPFDCILMDYDLGHNNGLSVAERVNAMLSDPPPIVMLTGGGSERTAVKAFRSGFSDYVSKRDLKLVELVGAVRGAVDRHEAARSARARTEALQQQLEFNATTGLYDMRFIRARLDEFTVRGTTHRFCVIVVDLPQLADVRAELGYMAGERLLRAFASRLRDVVTPDDLAGHLDNDGFIILVDRPAALTGVDAMVERLANALSQEFTLDRTQIRIEPQIATAHFPESGTSADALLAAARPARAEVPTASAIAMPAQPTDAGAPDLDASATQLIQKSERRAERRQRVLRQAKIKLNGHSTVIDCNVRDLTTRGARLRVDSYFAVPAEFDLAIVGTGTTRRVATRWQIGRDIGVEFVAEVP